MSTRSGDARRVRRLRRRPGPTVEKLGDARSWDMRGIIALLVVLGTGVYQLVIALNYGPEAEVPIWMGTTIGMVVVYYFQRETRLDREATARGLIREFDRLTGEHDVNGS